MKKIVVFSLAALGFSGLAFADLIPLNPPAVTVLGSTVTYTYSANLIAGSQLNNGVTPGFNNACTGSGGSGACGQFFTLYDIPNLNIAQTLAAAVQTGFTVSVSMLGNTNDKLLGNALAIADSGTLNNVTFTYTALPPANIVGPATLNPFSIVTTNTVLGTGNIAYSYNTPSSFNPANVSSQYGSSTVNGPMNAVPEPGSMLLIGGGLVGLALLRRKLVR